MKVAAAERNKGFKKGPNGTKGHKHYPLMILNSRQPNLIAFRFNRLVTQYP